MTVEIRRPELEAFITQHLQSGQFENAEDVLLYAIRASQSAEEPNDLSGDALIAAFQRSPCKEVDLVWPSDDLASSTPVTF